MKYMKIIPLTFLFVGFLASSLLAAGEKGSASWGLTQGEITTFPKGHVATVQYSPNRTVSYDKQHMPWFESTLNPRNLAE